MVDENGLKWPNTEINDISELEKEKKLNINKFKDFNRRQFSWSKAKPVPAYYRGTQFPEKLIYKKVNTKTFWLYFKTSRIIKLFVQGEKWFTHLHGSDFSTEFQ